MNKHHDEFKKDTVDRASKTFGSFLSPEGKERLEQKLAKDLEDIPLDLNFPSNAWNAVKDIAANEMVRDAVERHMREGSHDPY